MRACRRRISPSRRKPTLRRSRPRRSSTSRRCCGSTPAVRRATKRARSNTSSRCSTRKAFPTRCSPTIRSAPNLVARLKGNGKKRPILVMGHTDVVTVDPAKWTHPPFGAVRDGGYVYGRGAVDDKDNLVAGLMMMLMLKRGNVPLDRDVILLAESGEEGAPRRRRAVHGRQPSRRHQRRILPRRRWRRGADRRQGRAVATSAPPRRSRASSSSSRAGPAGHGSVPSRGNAVTKLSAAVGKVAEWSPPLRINETTGAYFREAGDHGRAADVAKMYRDVLNPDPKVSKTGGRLAARQRAVPLVDAPHLARADHRGRRVPLQRDSVGGEGDASTCACIRMRISRRFSIRCAR